MLRRDFVRAVVAVGCAPRLLLAQQSVGPAPPPPAPVAWTLGLNAKTPVPQTEVADVVASADLIFFTLQQGATLTRLCEVLLPPIGGKPGAIQAGTPLFLDFLIGSSPEARRKTYTGGLDWLDDEARQKYKTPFAQLSGAQADTLLKPWLRTWMSDHPPTEQHADFINIAHEDIRTASINSKAWSDAPGSSFQAETAVGLYWSPIEPDLHLLGASCFHAPALVIAAPKAAHTAPSYPQ